MYIIKCTRFDIGYSDSKLSRFTSNRSMDQWNAIKKVFNYLRCSLDNRLHYTSYPIVFEGYSDVNCISDTKNLKFISEYIFIPGRVAMPRKSSKQTCIIRSMMESEFIALDKSRNEAKWI